MKKLLFLLLCALLGGATSCGRGHEIENEFPWGHGPGSEIDYPAPTNDPDDGGKWE